MADNKCLISIVCLSADKFVSEWLPFIQRVVPLIRACFVSLCTSSAHFSAQLSQPQSGSDVRWCFERVFKEEAPCTPEINWSVHTGKGRLRACCWENNEGESHVCGENLSFARQVWKDTGWSKRLSLSSRDELHFFFLSFFSLYESRHGVSLNMVQTVWLCCNVSHQWQGKRWVSCCPYLAKEGLAHTVSAYFCGTDLFLKKIIYDFFSSFIFFGFWSRLSKLQCKKTCR